MMKMVVLLGIFAVLLVCGCSEKEEASTIEPTSDNEISSPDENWTTSVLATGILMILYDKDGSDALNSYDIILSTQTYSKMKSAAQEALSDSQSTNVSSNYTKAKSMYESALQKYVSGASAMLRAIRATREDTGLRLIGEATASFSVADSLMADTEEELNKIDPNWAGDEDK